MPEPSRFSDQQEIVCIQGVDIPPFHLKKGTIYLVAHACQYGPAVVLEGAAHHKLCYWDRWFTQVELASQEAIEQVVEEACTQRAAKP